MGNDLLGITTQIGIGGTDIFLDLPMVGGFFKYGFFSAISAILFYFLIFLVVVWIALGLYGAFLIISSFGSEDKIKKGFTTIKSVWIGIAYFLGFFMLVTLATVFMGIGAPWDWAENLQQCASNGPASGRFYFQGKDVPDPNDPSGFVTVSFAQMSREFSQAHPAAAKMGVYCCENAGKSYVDVGTNLLVAPSGCTVNAIVNRAAGSPAPSCKATGAPCSNPSECCSGMCEDFAGRLRCAPP